MVIHNMLLKLSELYCFWTTKGVMNHEMQELRKNVTGQCKLLP